MMFLSHLAMFKASMFTFRGAFYGVQEGHFTFPSCYSCYSCYLSVSNLPGCAGLAVQHHPDVEGLHQVHD